MKKHDIESAFFLGGKLHLTTQQDSGLEAYRHKYGGRRRILSNKSWTPAIKPNCDVYHRHAIYPIYCLVDYEPTYEDEEAAREWLSSLKIDQQDAN